MFSKKAVKRFVLSLFILCGLGIQGNCAPNSDGVGIGIVVGDPTGFAAKFWINHINAVDVMVGFGDENFHIDYLWHKFGVFPVSSGRLPLYYGFGGAAHFGKHPDIGVRVPFGITYLFPHDPIDIFFEIAPVIYVANRSELDLTAGAGIRFFFR